MSDHVALPPGTPVVAPLPRPDQRGGDMPGQPRALASKQFLQHSQLLLLVIAVYLYFTGWLYLRYYFWSFGIPIQLVDPPLYSVFVYSYAVVVSQRYLLAAVLLVGAAVAAVYGRFTAHRAYPDARSSGLGIAARRALIIIGFIILFPLLDRVARRAGRHDADEARRGYRLRPITLVLSDSARQLLPADLQQANAAGDLELLAKTTDDYFLLAQHRPSLKGPLPKGKVLIVPKGDVRAAFVRL